MIKTRLEKIQDGLKSSRKMGRKFGFWTVWPKPSRINNFFLDLFLFFFFLFIYIYIYIYIYINIINYKMMRVFSSQRSMRLLPHPRHRRQTPSPSQQIFPKAPVGCREFPKAKALIFFFFFLFLLLFFYRLFFHKPIFIRQVKEFVHEKIVTSCAILPIHGPRFIQNRLWEQFHGQILPEIGLQRSFNTFHFRFSLKNTHTQNPNV
jgi:hypothetical protein